MEWCDEGIIIGGRRHGETSLVLEVMTRGHGRHAGLVKGGRSKRLAPLLQPGNAVEVTWRARLEEHLGFYAVETTRQRAAELIGDRARLDGLNVLVAYLRLLAEREPHEFLYEEACRLLDGLDRATVALVRFELALLADCGFGLDLDECAATGRRDDLVYVSPKSARAVSRTAGEPYRDKLLALPAFLRDAAEGPDAIDTEEIDAAFRLTGFFLERNLFAPRGLALPSARESFVAQVLRDAERLAPILPHPHGEGASKLGVPNFDILDAHVEQARHECASRTTRAPEGELRGPPPPSRRARPSSG